MSITVGIMKVMPDGADLVLNTRVLEYDEIELFPIKYSQGVFHKIGKTPDDYFSLIKSSFPRIKEWIESGSCTEYAGKNGIKNFPIKTDGYVP